MSKLFIDILTFYRYNAGQNVLQKLKKLRYIKKDFKKLISAFAKFLITIATKSFLEGRRDTGPCTHLVL